MTSNKGLEVGIAMAAGLGIVAAFFISIVWGGFWVGLALSSLWGWFVVPLFSLPVLTVWQAYGLALVIRTLQANLHSKTGDSHAEFWVKAFVAPPVVAGLLLLVGWCVKAWA